MPFDQYGAWMLDRSPWDPAPAPPVVPGSLAPYDQGAPPSVQGGPFDLPPWGVHDVPDLAGAVQAGADSVAASQAIQPEQLPERTPQEDADKIQIEQPPEIAFTPEEADAIARGEPYDANQIQIEQPAGSGAPVSAPAAGRKVAVQPAPYSAPPWANPMLIKLAEVRDEIANTPPGPDRDALTADLEAQTAWMTAHGIPVPPSGDEGIVIEQPGEPTDQIGAPEEHDGPPFAAGGGDITPGSLFNAPVGHAASDAEVLDSAYAYANATPEQQAEMDANEAALFATKRQTMELAQAQADQKALEDNIRIAKQAREKAAADMAQLQADVQGMADSSPIESWWADRSTMGKLAGIVGAIFSGLANPQGPNGAIEMMMKTADQDAAQKWKKIEARRQMLGEQRAANEDDATARERIRLASREQAIRMIETQMNGLDPQGTQAINLGKTIAGLRADDVKALEAKLASDAAQNERDAKQALEVWKAQDAHDQWAASHDLAIAKFNRAGMGAGKAAGLFDDKAKYTAAQWAQIEPRLADRLKTMRPDQELTGKDIKDLLEINKNLGNIDESGSRKGSVDQGVDFAKKQIVLNDPITHKPMTGDSESSLVYNAALKADLDEMLPAAADVITFIDNTRRLIKEHGGEPGFLHSKAWQEAVSNKGFITGSMGKLTKGGALDAGMVANVEGMLGATDPTSYLFNAEPGLVQARNNILTTANHKIGAAGIAKRWDVPDTGNIPFATKDPEGARVSSRGEDDGPIDRLGKATRRQAGDLDPTLYAGITDEQWGGLHNLKADLDRPAHADNAAAQLARNAASAPNPQARTAAAFMLWQARKAGNPAAAKAFASLDRSAQTAALANLPSEEAWQAFRELFPAAPGGR